MRLNDTAKSNGGISSPANRIRPRLSQGHSEKKILGQLSQEWSQRKSEQSISIAETLKTPIILPSLTQSRVV